MSSSESNPQILVNGEDQQQQQQQQQEEKEAAAAEGQMSSVNLDEERSEAAEKEKQAKMQSLFQQVRTQIRSQVSMKATKNSILELMQRVREMETAQVNGEPAGGEDVSGEGEEEEAADESKDETDLKQEEPCAVFDKRLEASKKALRDEFQVQISQVRAEMQAYTDQALKDLECKMNSRQPHNLQQQQESRGPDRKQKPSAPSSLAPRRGRVLTRTMTTIIPKTCAPVVVGPRAKSETLSCSKGESSRVMLRDPLLHAPGCKQCPSRRPLLPPACPPLQQRKRPVWAKAQTGK